MPSRFHSINEGDSSKPSVIDRGVPPSAETMAMRELWWKEGLPIDEPKAISLPSGDQRGPKSPPGCETIFLTASSARLRTKMSAVKTLMRSGLIVAPKAMRVESGDQLKSPTLKSLPLVRCLPLAGDSKASATSMV